MIEYLVEKGANMEVKSRYVSDVISLMRIHTHVIYAYARLCMCQHGYTPLMMAAVDNRLPIVKYLVERGADPNAQDNVSEQLNINHLFATLV